MFALPKLHTDGPPLPRSAPRFVPIGRREPHQRSESAAAHCCIYLGTLPIMVRCNRLLLCSSSLRDDDDSNQPQKADKLHEEEREAHGCYGVSVDEAYVH